MKDLLNIKYWLFDLDNTLYSGDTKVFDQVDKRMSKYISKKLKTVDSQSMSGVLGGSVDMETAFALKEFFQSKGSFSPLIHSRPLSLERGKLAKCIIRP